jgi:macrolide transport system ATP-binding/permease protein
VQVEAAAHPYPPRRVSADGSSLVAHPSNAGNRETGNAGKSVKNVIEIIGLSKTFHLGEVEVRALRGVSLTINRGEFVAIMGASGSGKSTLMNILGCLDRPTAGKYLLEGVDVASMREEELAAVRSRRIGFIFQNFNLLSRTSALENVELPLFYSGWADDAKQRAHELLKMVGLKDREQNYPNQLSGGQQQRVAIARALINEPAILLADEPTGNLDSTNSAELMEIIARLNRKRGLTVVVVTHDPEVAEYTDRVVTFRDGQIISDDRKRDGAGAAAAALGAPSEAEAAAARPVAERGGEAWSFGAMALSAARCGVTRCARRARCLVSLSASRR